jgi:hypothetical protein
MKLIKTVLILILVNVSFLASCRGNITEKSSLNDFDFSQIEGRMYYLLQDGFTCRANAPGKPILKSWKNRIKFKEGEVLVWDSVCNDNPTLNKFKPEEFSFSEDLSSLEYQSEQYTFYEEVPKLCPQGQWCPVTN